MDTDIQLMVKAGHKDLAKGQLILRRLIARWDEQKQDVEALKLDLNPHLVFKAVAERVASEVGQELGLQVESSEVLLAWLCSIITDPVRWLI